jgi:hypothetical protein
LIDAKNLRVKNKRRSARGIEGADDNNRDDRNINLDYTKKMQRIEQLI